MSNLTTPITSACHQDHKLTNAYDAFIYILHRCLIAIFRTILRISMLMTSMCFVEHLDYIVLFLFQIDVYMDCLQLCTYIVYLHVIMLLLSLH
jgi:hypothetical protein